MMKKTAMIKSSLDLILSFTLAGFCLGQDKKEDLDEGDLSSSKMEEAGEIFWAAQNKFMEERRKAEAVYRSSLAEAFRLVDRAELVLLDFKVIPKPKDRPVGDFFGEVEGYERKDYLFVPTSDVYAKILKTEKVSEDSLKRLLGAMIEVFNEPVQPRGPMGHVPVRGVRLYIGDELFFETSFCWRFGNYFMRMTGSWDGMWVDFRGEKLKTFFDKEMPIPQVELDRINAKYGPKKK